MKNKILLVTTSFPGILPETSGRGGAPFLLREVRALLAVGYEVDVVMPALRAAPAIEREGGLTIRRVAYPLQRINSGFNGKPQHGDLTLWQRLSQVMMALRLFFEVIRLSLGGRYHLLWSNWLQVGVVSSLANIKRIPHLVTIRGSDVRESTSAFVTLAAKLIPNLLNMYPDDPEIASWVARYKFNNFTVPGVFEPRNITRRDAGRIITVIGRFDGESASYFLKGLGVPLFLVLDQLLHLRDDVSVVVVGDGSSLDECKSIVHHWGDRVLFKGWKTSFDDELSSSTLVIGGSGMNGVVMDAVPNAIPVLISKNLTGTLWRDGVNCLVFDPDDSDGFVGVLNYALSHKELLDSMAVAARDDLKQFASSVSTAGKKWDNVLTRYIAASSK